jgi:hypothetical protein
MGVEDMILKAGELIDHVVAAVQEHGATPHTELRVRVGTMGPVYRVQQLKGVQDERGFSLLLELSAVPESYG